MQLLFSPGYRYNASEEIDLKTEIYNNFILVYRILIF